MTAMIHDTQELAGRHALVTGAGSGIGLATACTLSARGARVAAVVQDAGQVQAVRARLPDAVVLVQDLLDDAACAALPALAAKVLGSGVQALLTHPEQCERLRREPALLPSAVREFLRFDSPVQYTGRRVATDMVLHGQQLRRGDLVLPLIGAASRDPARYTRPDTLDITRNEGPSLAFGVGPHVCLGAALTRIEAEIVFRQVLARWPDLRLQDASAHWGSNPAYRGLVALPLVHGASVNPAA